MSTAPAMIGPTSYREKRRRWPWRCAMLLLAVGLLVFFAPAIASCRVVRDAIVRLVLPEETGRLQLDSLQIGWLTPIEASGVRYRSDRIELVAERAQCDRTLLELIKDPNNLGCVRLTAPQLTVMAPKAVPGNSRAKSEPDAVRSPVPAVGPTAAIELQATRGSLAVLDQARGGAWRAREVELRLQTVPGDSRAGFRLLARTGDPHTTAHVAAHGWVNWPLQSLRDSLVEAHVDIVGVDATHGRRLLALLGLPPTTAAVRGPDLRVAGVVTGSAELRRTARGAIDVRTNLAVQDCSVTGGSAGWQVAEPLLTVSAVASLDGATLRLDSLRLAGNSVTLDAAGTVTDPAGAAYADLSGSAICDWQAIGTQLRSIVPEGVNGSGRVRRPWRLHGPLAASESAERFDRLEAAVATRLDSLELFGVALGPIELKLHWKDGQWQCDPIEASLKGGRIAAQPSVRFVNGVPLLQLAPGRVLDNIAIDRNLCDRVVRYVDPLFEVSDDLRGQLSLEIDRLELPLAPGGLEYGTLQGRLLLDEVEFTPGASLKQILSAAGLPPGSSIRTSQSIAIRLEDGRVHHHGLTLPVGDDRITLEGFVGLDRSLNIRVSVPVTEQLLGKDKRLYRLLRGQHIVVPVTGTLEQPKVNEDVFAHNLQRLVQIALRDGLNGNDPVRGLLRRALK